MDERNSMNVTNTVASDTFGDNAEGNVGEFLRHLPGVELNLFYGEVRNVSLRGLGAEYTSITVDGVSLASADANAGGSAAGRAFTMENTSLNSMDSIEVSKTISADVDANAPAGTINLRTKRAFDRVGRRITWQTNVAMHSEEFTLSKTPGPDDDGPSRKLRPGGIFEYSDVFLNKRLGVVLNVSESNVYQEAFFTTMSVNRLSYRRHRINVDGGAGWRLTNRISLSASVRNILNTPYINMQHVAPSVPVITRYEVVGISYTFAVKGTF